MIDFTTIKDFLVPKRFGVVGYTCVIFQFLFTLAFISVTGFYKATEDAKFSCFVDAKSTATYKKLVDQACLTRYNHVYSPNLPLWGFVLLSIGFPLLISVVYSLIVRNRVDEIESCHERQTDEEADEQEHNRRTVNVFNWYLTHLVFRALHGIILTVLQYKYFYCKGFDFKYDCNYNSTFVTCENSRSSGKWNIFVSVSVINSIIVLAILVEVFYLVICHCRADQSNIDITFVSKYFLNKRYTPVERLPLTAIESVYLYKQEVLKCPRFDFFIELLIHSKRAPHIFPQHLDNRHEIYDVYTNVPETSIRLENIKDLFYPNEDTGDMFPRSILVIGRPGIGKTILSEKIIREWAEATNQINEHYCNKIAFFFQLRWFNNVEEMSLKKFLQSGTPRQLSEEQFETIFKEIIEKPEKAILVFDGLDEFQGDYNKCLNNDPNTTTSPMNLFINLVLGHELKGATVLVTSRPTADDFYSRLKFDRTVEIIGFTHDRIEEYVRKFCANNNVQDPESKVWNHIKSSSELLNLCYIPVNCFIICVTLSGRLSDTQNHTDLLPTTLTELYLNALHYFEKYDQDRNADRSPMTEQTLKKLQQVAFRGIENGQLIFAQELINEEMKKSSFLNSLSNPIFPIEIQFYFTHLTIQEFLAAKHVTETHSTAEIKEFVSDRIEIGKWHLVLQFIAGLLGKKIKMFGKEYKECISVFVSGISGNEMSLGYNEVFSMKCLREVDDDEIIKYVCETSAVNDIEKLRSARNFDLLSSDMAAVTAVGKHMRNLKCFKFIVKNMDNVRFVSELLQKRCIKELFMSTYFQPEVDVELIFSALVKLKCTLNHRHAKLTSLYLVSFSMNLAALSSMCTFFKNGHGSHLKSLTLMNCGINSSVTSELAKLLKDGCCAELGTLCLNWNDILDQGAKVLFDTLPVEGLCHLTILEVSKCSLTHECISSLCKALQDERCQLTDISLTVNEIRDEGACMLFENALRKVHCKLTKLDLRWCSLTHRCIPELIKTLQDERCQLTVLSLQGNKIRDEGACMLFENALRNVHCKLTKFDLYDCGLTHRCVPKLVKTLQDERCQLTVLSLGRNEIRDEGVCMLFKNALRNVHCKLTYLNLCYCSLTDECVTEVREALEDEHFRCRIELRY